MSNLRSDCRNLIEGRPPGDTWKVHIEALCHQIDLIEEKWHEAERKAKALTEQLESVREHVETIVEAEGEDAGVILLSDEAPTKYDPHRKCQVYLHENFSPLGNALVLLHQMTAPAAGQSDRVSELKEIEQKYRDLHDACIVVRIAMRRHDPRTSRTVELGDRHAQRIVDMLTPLGDDKPNEG